MHRLIAGLLVVGLVVAGTAAWPAGTASAQAVAACPTGVTMTVSAPTAAAPSTVSVSITPTLNIKPATAADLTSFHLHYFVDTAATAAGTAIPTGDAKIIHSGTTTQDLGALAAGSHTVTVVLGRLDHVACDARATVTFATAAAPAAAPVAAPAKTGNAGLVDGGTGWSMLLASAGLTLAAVAGGRALVARRREA